MDVVGRGRGWCGWRWVATILETRVFNAEGLNDVFKLWLMWKQKVWEGKGMGGLGGGGGGVAHAFLFSEGGQHARKRPVNLH